MLPPDESSQAIVTLAAAIRAVTSGTIDQHDSRPTRADALHRRLLREGPAVERRRAGAVPGPLVAADSEGKYPKLGNPAARGWPRRGHPLQAPRARPALQLRGDTVHVPRQA